VCATICDHSLLNFYFNRLFLLPMVQIYKYRLFFAALLIAFNISSCTSSKHVVYLNDLKDTLGAASVAQIAFENPIQIPYIGKVQAQGLTRIQLEDTLTQLLKDYTKNPIVNVRFLNYYCSVLGEVSNRGRFAMQNERMTILEAISMAGDLTEFGKRDNVLVVREVNGKRNFARVNLLSKNLFNSPYFYLKTNDVVYVEPVKSKFISRNGVPQYLGIAAVGLSLLITIINLRK
jgi:protein involved in polysaccharide export with SLBB domain